MEKRGPGRPKTRPEPKGIGRTELADHLGVGVKQIDKWLREGCPVAERRDGRVFFDVAAVEDWRDVHEADEAESIPKAKVLHPTDSRWRERKARAALVGAKAGLAAGRLLDGAEAFGRHIDACHALFARFPEIVLHFAGDTLPTAAELSEVVESLLDDFDIDDASRWPDPVPLVPVESSDDEPGNWGAEFDDDAAVEFVPVLGPDDPRSIVALVQAEKYEGELAALTPNLVETSAFLEWLRGDCERIRKLIRRMPARIMKRIEPGDPWDFIVAVLTYEGDRVRFDYCTAHGLECEHKPKVPTRAPEPDPDDMEVVDGPGNPDIDRIYAKTFPDIAPDAFEFEGEDDERKDDDEGLETEDHAGSRP